MRREDIISVRDLAQAVVPEFAAAMRDADRERGRVVLCLSGGSTPVPVFRALAQESRLPWARTWIAWGDERFVDPDHEDRNERATREALLNHVPVPEDQVLTWPWAPDADPELCAEAYEARLAAALGDADAGTWFDVTVLGLGSDGHTASLFPGAGATRAGGLATATRPASRARPRLTLTPRALSSSRHVWFLVSGEEKRDALAATLAGRDAEATPAIAIHAREDLRVYVDFAL